MKPTLTLICAVFILYSIDTSRAEEVQEIKCGANATVQNSGYNCQTCKLLTVNCLEVHRRQCYCKPGYVKRDRHDTDCIAYDDCPQPEPLCGENEVLKDEGSDCAKCSNYMFVKCAPIKERRCYCLDGYVRRDDNNVCTKTSDCPST